MRIFYDTEFIEDGRSIDLISIGMVTENGREYYAVNAAMPQRRIRQHNWLRAHVWWHLPLLGNDLLFDEIDIGHRDVKTPVQIAREVADFIEQTPDPQLWAWYGAYDHVVLMQLWGAMIDKPDTVPMWTNDIKQLQHHHIDPVTDDELEAAVPHDGAAHNALVDAKWNLAAFEYLNDPNR